MHLRCRPQQSGFASFPGWAWALAGAIAILMALYFPGAGGPFMLDDFSSLASNTKVHIDALTWSSLQDAAFSLRSGPLYRPVAYVSFALNHYAAGMLDPFGIKLINIVLHGMTALVLFFLTRRLLRQLPGDRLKESANNERASWIALFITSLWAFHPLHVSSVLYAVQRMTGLSALFTLGAALVYVKAREGLLDDRLRAPLLQMGLGVTLLGLLATLSKENGALLPVLLLIIELTFFRFKMSVNTPAWVRVALIWLLTLPTLMILGFLVYVWAGPLGVSPIRDFDATERVLTQARVLLFYLSQLFVPDITRMSLFHGDIDVSRGLLQPSTTLPAVATILVIAGVAAHALYRRKALVFAFAVLWFLGGHLLESTVALLEIAFEHRNYLPSYGPIFGVGYALARLSHRVPLRPALRYGLLFSVLASLATPLQHRVSQWSNISDFLVHELVNDPKAPRAWVSLAYAQSQRGLYEGAAEFYGKAGELEPGEVGHLVGVLATEIHALDRPSAPGVVNEILARLGAHPVSYYGAGQLFRLASSFEAKSAKDIGALATAAKVLESAVQNEKWPSKIHRATAFFLLGKIHIYRRRMPRAVDALESGLALEPDAHEPRLALVELLLRLGRLSAARQHVALVNDTDLIQADAQKLHQLRVHIAKASAQNNSGAQ